MANLAACLSRAALFDLTVENVVVRKFANLQWIMALCALTSFSGCQSKAPPTAPSTTVASSESTSGSSQSSAEKKPTIQGHVGTGPEIELESTEPPQDSSANNAPAVEEGTLKLEYSSDVTEAPDKGASNTNTVPAVTASTERVKPTLGNVATEAERNQKIAEDWPKPQAVIYVSGQQQGYIEPCGCTGLESQKGGLIRRDTLLTSLRNRGWEVIPVDVGNQNREKRSIGPQPQIKFDTTAKAMQMMEYQAVSLGVHDLELTRVDLLQVAGSNEGSPRPFICANVVVFSDPEFFPAFRIVEAGGRKIGITSVIGKELESKVIKDPKNEDEVTFSDPQESLKKVIPNLKSQGCDFIVLLAHASLEESAVLGAAIEGIDLVVTSGGYGEPTLNAEPIKDSKAVMVQVGTKGMYGGIIGLFDDAANPIRYQKIAISSQFKDSDRMLKLFTEYQDRLRETGFAGLGLSPSLHPTGAKFVGSEKCGDCHTQAFEIWKKSPHVHATDSIVAANNDRGGIARHFDPECVSCHVTGWEPQRFSPYQTGYESLEKTPHLLGSGCENCHGPGSAHVAAEEGDVEATPDRLKELRQEMVLPLAKAEAKCMECHDLDNSPDFHATGAFEKYWDRVKHYGKD